MCYYKIPLNNNREPDVERLEQLNVRSREEGFFHSRYQDLVIGLTHMEWIQNWNIMTGFKHIDRAMNNLLQLAEKQDFEPCNRSSIEELSAMDPMMNGPSIESFWEAYSQE